MEKGKKNPNNPSEHYCHHEHLKDQVWELQQEPAPIIHHLHEAELVLHSPQQVHIQNKTDAARGIFSSLGLLWYILTDLGHTNKAKKTRRK